MGERYSVRRETLQERKEGSPGWLVVNDETGEIVARYTRRTDWLDVSGEHARREAAAREHARQEAAAREHARRLNSTLSKPGGGDG